MKFDSIEKELKDKHGISNNEQYGFKGFDSNLECRNFKYKVGEEYSKPEKEVLRTCTKDGFHYCNTIAGVLNHYKNDGKNRFCIIRITGNFKEDYNKSITTSLIIVEEITGLINDSIIEDNICLETVRSIQTRYPTLHVCGSIALFLHGVKLKRLSLKKCSDIDMVCPYFILFESDETHTVKYEDAKASGNDFDGTFIYDDIKVDIRIDNKQHYEIISYKGFKYKVSLFETIMEAKIKYALSGQSKHKLDIYEICGKKQKN